MLPTYQSEKSEVVLPNDQLHRYLSNRRHLDFALKLALGSQACLHDISSIHSGSNMSFDSIEHQLSPVRSADESLDKRFRGQKSRFCGEKQNISRLSNFRSQQKSPLRKSDTISQSPNDNNRLQCINGWMEFVKDRCKLFSREPLNTSRLSQRSKQAENLQTKEGINQFFRQVVFRLEKLQMVEKQEYNSKLLLCQLTESTLRESELQEKVKVLKKEVDEKMTVIRQQEQIIVRLLNARKFDRQPFITTILKQSSPKNSPTESLLKYSLTDNEEQNTITKQMNSHELRQDQQHYVEGEDNQQQAEQQKSQPSPKAKHTRGLQFFESPIKRRDSNKFVYETTAGYQVETTITKNMQKADQLFEETERQEKEDDCSREKEKSVEESLLLDYLNCQKTMQKLKDPVKQNEIINQVLQSSATSKNSLENSKWFMPNETKQEQASICEKISDSAMLEIRQEVERLITQNQELKGQVSRLQEEVDLLKVQHKSQEKQQNSDKDQNSCHHCKNLLELPAYDKEVNDTATQYQSESATNDFHQNSNLFTIDTTKFHLNVGNENTDTVNNMKDEVHKNGQDHLFTEKQKCNNFLQPNFFKTNKHTTEEQQNKSEDISHYQEKDQSNLLEDSQFKPQHSQNSNLSSNFQNQQILEKANNINPQLKQTILLLVEDNRKLLQKLRRKKAQLKNIRQIIRKAKSINEEDMHKLQTTIQHRKARRSIEITELKEMQIKWNTQFREVRSKKTKKTQILNEQLRLKVNPKIFKFAVPKSKQNA